MLEKLLLEDFGKAEDYNCAEKIVYGANVAYELGIAQEDLKLSAAFGGGMGYEGTCGAVTGGLMVLGRLFTETVQHQSDQLRPLTDEFLKRYRESMGSLECKPLKERHKTEEEGCKKVILAAAKILDDIRARELK